MYDPDHKRFLGDTKLQRGVEHRKRREHFNQGGGGTAENAPKRQAGGRIFFFYMNIAHVAVLWSSSRASAMHMCPAEICRKKTRFEGGKHAPCRVYGEACDQINSPNI